MILPRSPQKEAPQQEEDQQEVGGSSSISGHEELLSQYNDFFKERGLAMPDLSLEPKRKNPYIQFANFQAQRPLKSLESD